MSYKFVEGGPIVNLTMCYCKVNVRGRVGFSYCWNISLNLDRLFLFNAFYKVSELNMSPDSAAPL